MRISISFKECVLTDEIRKMAEETGKEFDVAGCAECSALTGEGVTELFQKVVHEAIMKRKRPKRKKGKCGIV